MENNHQISNSINERLRSSQLLIWKEVISSYWYLKIQSISVLALRLSAIIFLILTITQWTEFSSYVPYIAGIIIFFISRIFSFHVLFSTMRDFRKKIQLLNDPDVFESGITTTIHALLENYYNSMRIKKEDFDVNPEQIPQNIKKFNVRMLFSIFTGGIGILILIILIGVFEPGYLISPYFYVSYGICATLYILVTVFTIKNNRVIESWVTNFGNFKQWEKKIEDLPSNTA